MSGLTSWVLDETQEPEALLLFLQPPEVSLWLRNTLRPGSDIPCPLLDDLLEVGERQDWDTCEELGDPQLASLTLLILLTLLKQTGLLTQYINKNM